MWAHARLVVCAHVWFVDERERQGVGALHDVSRADIVGCVRAQGAKRSARVLFALSGCRRLGG